MSVSSSIKLPGPLVAVRLISPDAITVPVSVGAVKVLLVKVSVVALPTKVSLFVAGKVNVLVPATAVACTVVVPDVDPVNPNDATGEALLRNKIKSDDVSTCLTDAPAL